MTKPMSDLIRGVLPDRDTAWDMTPPGVAKDSLVPALIPSITSSDTLLYRRGWLSMRRGETVGAVVGDDAGKVWWVPTRMFPLLPVELNEEVTEEMVCRTWARLRRKGITWKEMQMVEKIRELSDAGRAEVVRLIDGRGE